MLKEFGLVSSRTQSLEIGDEFGRLTVVDVGTDIRTGRVYGVCRCVCGTLKKVRYDALTRGGAMSCGCLQVEASTTHGMTNSGHYGRWRHMMDRCYSPTHEKFAHYGGRGITVCDAWHDVAVYVAQLPRGYKKGAELDRIENDKGYEPSNVRWSTSKQNNDNRRNSVRLSLKGKTQSQKDWARELGVSDVMIHTRMKRLGWSEEKALSTPTLTLDRVVRKANKARWAGHETKGKPAPKTARRRLSVEYQGKPHTMADLSALCGISTKDLRRRIVELGWPVERAIVK